MLLMHRPNHILCQFAWRLHFLGAEGIAGLTDRFYPPGLVINGRETTMEFASPRRGLFGGSRDANDGRRCASDFGSSSIGIGVLLSALVAAQITEAKGIREAPRNADARLILGIGMVLQGLLTPVDIILFLVERYEERIFVVARLLPLFVLSREAAREDGPEHLGRLALEHGGAALLRIFVVAGAAAGGSSWGQHTIGTIHEMYPVNNANGTSGFHICLCHSPHPVKRFFLLDFTRGLSVEWVRKRTSSRMGPNAET